MPRNTSVSLGGHLETFVDQMVNQGHYHSVSEVIRAGLRLLEEQELRVQRLREALIAGENSGQPQSFDRETFKQSMREEPGK
ncbi:MAG: type II toxin-antitoxin system ParD family antitoxin [Gammaproteobacteria bacterium]|nr:type II toxin-antitoxin system ParD family antitoxin [Gammaproteobacteria bacterium]MBU1725393.1 type II toxin-antitoxin system ParD family antitoxin [Gammaproteobacteria bacterium]MBU2005263.1 type II toxin-antitoxin system ParD family antitoxin [Gammaproteobacteria bacterium]